MKYVHSTYIHIINANLKLVKNLRYNLATKNLKFNEVKYHHQTNTIVQNVLSI